MLPTCFKRFPVSNTHLSRNCARRHRYVRLVSSDVGMAVTALSNTKSRLEERVKRFRIASVVGETIDDIPLTAFGLLVNNMAAFDGEDNASSFFISNSACYPSSIRAREHYSILFASSLESITNTCKRSCASFNIAPGSRSRPEPYIFTISRSTPTIQDASYDPRESCASRRRSSCR
nr:hypothetical protein CFP56_67009 [Quercus suber]